MNKKTSIIVCIAAILLFGVLSTIAAPTLKITERNNGISAQAEWVTLNGEGTYNYIAGIATKTGTDLYFETCASAQVYETCKYGNSFTTENVLTVNKKLNSATLNIPSMVVYDYNGNPETLYDIQVQWQGFGEIENGGYKYSSRNEGFVFRTRSDSKERSAVATLSINNIDKGISSYGNMGLYKSAYMEMHK